MIRPERATSKAHEWAPWDDRPAAPRSLVAALPAVAPPHAPARRAGAPEGPRAARGDRAPEGLSAPGRHRAPGLPRSVTARSGGAHPSPVASPTSDRDVAAPDAVDPVDRAAVRAAADAWETFGVAWDLPPATSRVQGLLLVVGRPLTEREVRETLGLSHRAASIALADAEVAGLVVRAADRRRTGRRGPAGTAWAAERDAWRWLGALARRRWGASAAARALEEAAAAAPPGSDLRSRLVEQAEFVRLLDRATAAVAALPPRDLELQVRGLASGPGENAAGLPVEEPSAP